MLHLLAKGACGPGNEAAQASELDKLLSFRFLI